MPRERKNMVEEGAGKEISEEAREFKTPEKLVEESRLIVKEVLGKYQEAMEDVPESERTEYLVEFEGKKWYVGPPSCIMEDLRSLSFYRYITPPGIKQPSYREITRESFLIEEEGNEILFAHDVSTRAGKNLVSERIDPAGKVFKNEEDALDSLKEIREAVNKGKFKFIPEKI